MTGDKALRKAAQNEKVEYLGTLGLIDGLYAKSLLSPEEHESCLRTLLEWNGKGIRLPLTEIEKRLKNNITSKNESNTK